MSPTTSAAPNEHECLPDDHHRELGSCGAEGLEDGELAPIRPHGGDQQVREDADAQQRDEAGQDQRGRRHVGVAGDVGRRRRARHREILRIEAGAQVAERHVRREVDEHEVGLAGEVGIEARESRGG